MDAAFEDQRRDDAEGDESEPVEEASPRECDRIPMIFAREVVSVNGDDKEIMKLVPDRSTEGLHERCYGCKNERDSCLANFPQLILLVRKLVQ